MLKPGDMVLAENPENPEMSLRFIYVEDELGPIKVLPPKTMLLFLNYTKPSDRWHYIGTTDGEIADCLFEEAIIRIHSRNLKKIDDSST